MYFKSKSFLFDKQVHFIKLLKKCKKYSHESVFSKVVHLSGLLFH